VGGEVDDGSSLLPALRTGADVMMSPTDDSEEARRRSRAQEELLHEQQQQHRAVVVGLDALEADAEPESQV